MAKSQKGTLERAIKNSVDKEIDRAAQGLAKKPVFQENADTLAPDIFSDTPLAHRIVTKARTYAEEKSAHLAKQLENLAF